MYSHNLHHGTDIIFFFKKKMIKTNPNQKKVKGSRSLDAGHHGQENPVSNSNKVTNKPISKDMHTYHARSHSNSSSTSLKKSPSLVASEKDYGTQHHAKTNLAGTPIFYLENKKSGNKLSRTFQQGIPEPGRSKNWPYLGYMVNGFKNLVLTFYFNWTMIFTAPLSSIAFIVVYPTTVTFLVLFEIGLKLFLEKWGGAQVVRYISLKFGQGNVYLQDFFFLFTSCYIF